MESASSIAQVLVKDLKCVCGDCFSAPGGFFNEAPFKFRRERERHQSLRFEPANHSLSAAMPAPLQIPCHLVMAAEVGDADVFGEPMLGGHQAFQAVADGLDADAAGDVGGEG